MEGERYDTCGNWDSKEKVVKTDLIAQKSNKCLKLKQYVINKLNIVLNFDLNWE